jgi:hypothetical protein
MPNFIDNKYKKFYQNLIPIRFFRYLKQDWSLGANTFCKKLLLLIPWITASLSEKQSKENWHFNFDYSSSN